MHRLTLCFFTLTFCAAAADQVGVPALDALPALPQPYILRDWKKTARDFDAVAFDFARRGQYLPIPWWDTTHVNTDRDIPALPAYLGSHDQKPSDPGNYETLPCLAALVGASRVGINKAPAGGTNWVELATGYFGNRKGGNLYLNRTNVATDESFWYELLPSILFYQLYDGYRATPGMKEQFRITADRWAETCRGMGGRVSPWTLPNFDHTAFNLKTGKPLDNGKWKEGDAAAAIAWIETLAASHLGEKTYRDAAEWGLQYLDTCQTNPFYECLMPFGAVAAARANAEWGTRHDVGKLLNWCFDGSNPRRWGMIAQRFGETDCHGLIGSVYPDFQYAFAMNTFSMVGALAPVARYDTRYAAALGKWLLNVAVRARLFYPDAWPENQQSGLAWQRQNLPENCIAYEGLREQGLRRTLPSADTPSGKNRFWTLHPPAGEHATLVVQTGCRTPNGTPYVFDGSLSTNGPWRTLFKTETTEDTTLWCDLAQTHGLTNGQPFFLRATCPADAPAATLSVKQLFIDTKLTQRPYAGGDPTYLGWGATDFGLYGSAFVGQLAAVVEATDVEGVLRFDLLATDSFAPPAWPTYLYYNPFPAVQRVTCPLPSGAFALYDAAAHGFIARNARRQAVLTLPGGGTVVLVICPDKGVFKNDQGVLSCDGRVIDYHVTHL